MYKQKELDPGVRPAEHPTSARFLWRPLIITLYVKLFPTLLFSLFLVLLTDTNFLSKRIRLDDHRIYCPVSDQTQDAVLHRWERHNVLRRRQVLVFGRFQLQRLSADSVFPVAPILWTFKKRQCKIVIRECEVKKPCPRLRVNCLLALVFTLIWLTWLELPPQSDTKVKYLRVLTTTAGMSLMVAGEHSAMAQSSKHLIIFRYTIITHLSFSI